MGLMSLKILHAQGAGDFLTEELKEMVQDERLWSTKMMKLYKNLRKLESRKYAGGHFATEMR